MGKKRTENPAAVSAQPQLVQKERISWRERAFPYLFAPLVFLSIASQGGRVFAILLTVILLLFGIGKHPAAMLKERMNPLFWAVLLYAGLCFVAGLYSDFGGSAMRESAKTLCAFIIFSLAVLYVKRENVRIIFQSLAVSCAVFGLISIDGSSLNVLTPAFSAFMNLFRVEYDVSTMGYETGVRIIGVFSNANVSAGVLAFGILISLYLVRTTDEKRKRIFDSILLGVNAMAFFLSFSMGAMAAFALSCLIYLAASYGQERLELLLLMFESLFATVVLAFVAYAFLGKIGAGSVIPLLCALANGFLIYGIHRTIVNKVLYLLIGQGKRIGIFIGALCGLLVIYVVLAINITGSISLPAGQTLSRTAYLKAGAYTVSEVRADGVGNVTIYSQNESELMMHTQTTLYTGALENAAFTVPNDSKVVWFDIVSGDSGCNLTSVGLSDGSALKLGYRLLPGFVANRIQGLGANQNFIQRLVFFRDGLKLWKQSPIIGFGLSGVEGRLTQVQSFYYETKYIHNQFIQVLDEMGLIGLGSFVFLLGSGAAMLIRRHRERTPLLAVLAACMTMMVAHSMTEVVWSTSMYQITTFLVFAGILITNDRPPARLRGRAMCVAVTIWMCLFASVSALLLGGTMLAAAKMQAIQEGKTQITSQSEFLKVMQGLIRMDVYDDEAYKINYIGNAITTGNSKYMSQAAAYARQLRSMDEYTACSDVATYYYLPMGELQQFFAASRAAIMQEASNKDAWNNQFKIYQEAFSSLKKEDMGDYVTGILSIRDDLDQFNTGRMAQILLTEENQTFLNLIASVQGKDNVQIYSELSQSLGK